MEDNYSDWGETMVHFLLKFGSSVLDTKVKFQLKVDITMVTEFFKIAFKKYSLKEFNSLSTVEKYLVSLCRDTKDIAEGLNQEELDSQIRTFLSTPENFIALEQGARELAIKLSMKSYCKLTQGDLDVSQSCHPLVMASRAGNIKYLKMAFNNDAAWHHSDYIIHNIMHSGVYSWNRSERYEMLNIVAQKGLYNMIKTPFSGRPNNYKPEPKDAEENSLKKLFSTSLDQLSHEEVLNLDKRYGQHETFKEIFNNKLREAEEQKEAVRFDAHSKAPMASTEDIGAFLVNRISASDPILSPLQSDDYKTDHQVEVSGNTSGWCPIL